MESHVEKLYFIINCGNRKVSEIEKYTNSYKFCDLSYELGHSTFQKRKSGPAQHHLAGGEMSLLSSKSQICWFENWIE